MDEMSVCSSAAKSRIADADCASLAIPALFTGNMAICFHILHNNLICNLRLSFYLSYPTIGWIFWTPVNILICKCGRGDEGKCQLKRGEGCCGCQTICRDRCVTSATIAKTILLFVYSFFAFYVLTAYADTVDLHGGEDFIRASILSHKARKISLLCIYFGFQHLIFFCAKICIFICL